MRKKIQLINRWYCLVLFSFFWSCETYNALNEDISPSSFQSPIPVVDGRLAFPSSEAVKEFLITYAEKEPSELQRLVRQIQDNSEFKSALPTYDESEYDSEEYHRYVQYRIKEYNRLRKLNDDSSLNLRMSSSSTNQEIPSDL